LDGVPVAAAALVEEEVPLAVLVPDAEDEDDDEGLLIEVPLRA
jgi:hypothetical protein